jgi:hypothetical protein
VLALAVDVHQALADVFEKLQIDRRPIDPTNVAPVAAQFACQHDLVRRVHLDAFGFQRRFDLRGQARRQLEDAFHSGLLVTGAHKVGVGAAPQQHLHGVDDDRFARAGLAVMTLKPGARWTSS